MGPTLKRLAKITLVGSGLLFFALIALWLALPGLIQSQASQYIAEKSGHRLSLAKPELNLFELSLRLGELRLDDPQGTRLLAFDQLLVDLDGASLRQKTLAFDAIHVAGLSARLAIGADGKLNWQPLLDALRSKEDTPDKALPRIDIRHLKLAAAHIDFSDARSQPPFAAAIEPLDIELRDLSTLPNDQGQIALTATTSLGAKLAWRGDITLNPAASHGVVEISDLDLSRLAPLLQARLPLPPPSGFTAVKLDYRLSHANGKPTLALEKIAASLSSLVLRPNLDPAAPHLAVGRIELVDGRFDLAEQRLALAALTLGTTRLEPAQQGSTAPLQLDSIALSDIQADLANRQAKVGDIRLAGGRLALRRDAAGKLELQTLLTALLPPPAAAESAAAPAATPTGGAAPAWRYHIGKLAIDDFGIRLRDEAQTPPLELGIDKLRFAVGDISEQWQKALSWQAGFAVASGGGFEATGQATPATAAVDARFKLSDLALRPVQPYLGRVAALDLADGRLSVHGRISHDAKASRFRGGFALNDLRLVEAGSDKLFLAWKSLASGELEATPDRLDIAELRLDGLDTQLLIDKDKSLNAKRLLRRADAASPAPSIAAPTPTAAVERAQTPAAAVVQAAAPAAPRFVARIERLRLTNSELDFADHSLLFPFATRIHRLRGSINGLSTEAGAPGQIELEGQVDDFGMARAAGEVDFHDPAALLNVKLAFRNLDMARLTPYMATFAGRRIDGGKLSLALDYTIAKRQLQSSNQLIIDRLVLGERVDSPGASSLPLDLAVAILEDSDGRIDLDLPISGSLDDPQFSYGHLVWKAIGNVIGKIVTAPFRALASLFGGGGGGETIDSIAFEAGAGRLTPPEREKLVKLAAALVKRPNLVLGLQATWNEADRMAWQDRQLRRQLLAHGKEAGSAVAEAAGETRGDPGPVSTRQPRIQAALEALYTERLGKTALAGLKEAFRQANPGQLEESTGARMMSRLSGLLRENRAPDANEVASLKGADFHAVLYQRLRDGEQLDDEAMQRLARRRADNALADLQTAGAPAARLRPGASEKSTDASNTAALKLTLQAPGN